MTIEPGLHMMCGKIASGKSTLAEQIRNDLGAVLIAEDAWLHALYAEQMTSVADYVRCMGLLRSVIGPHVVSLLRAGVSVVLDFQANTLEARAWMRGLIEDAGVEHCLHVLETPDAMCLERLRSRNATGEHPFSVSEDQFWQVTRHFVAPSSEEGFCLKVHRPIGP